MQIELLNNYRFGPFAERGKKHKEYSWTCLQNRNRLTDVENKLMVVKGEGWGER